MNVVVLTAAYPAPSEPTRAIYIENMTRALVEDPEGDGGERVDAAVVAPRVAPTDPLLETRAGIRVRRFPYPSAGRRLKEMSRPSTVLLAAYFLSALRSALDEARRCGADIILCHWVLPTGPVGAVVSSLLGIPLVLVAHGSDLNRYASASRFRGWLARRSLGRARCVLAVSAELRRLAVERFAVPPGRASVFKMGVDDRLFAAGDRPRRRDPATARRELGLDPEAALLLFVGDLIPEKGIQDLADAVGEVRRRGLPVSAACIGDGPFRNGEGPGAGNGLLFPGRVPQADLVRWYEAADLLVLPSWSEGSPVTVMEALSSGLPVVAARVGGIPELIEDGFTGWLVPPRDPRALSALLEGLLRNGDALAAARRRLEESPPDHSAARGGRELRRTLAAVLREGVHDD